MTPIVSFGNARLHKATVTAASMPPLRATTVPSAPAAATRSRIHCTMSAVTRSNVWLNPAFLPQRRFRAYMSTKSLRQASLFAVHVSARIARTDYTEHFVCDSAQMPRPLLRRNDRTAVVASQQRHDAASAHGRIARVDHAMVHANAADDGPSTAVHQHFQFAGQKAADSVGVADGQCNDSRLARRTPRAAVAD